MAAIRAIYPFIVIDRDGYRGREGKVHSTHQTRSAAERAARRHVYKDEFGLHRTPVVVAHNELSRYRAGSTFWSEMPPVEVEAC